MLDPTSRRALATARILTVAFALACVLYVLVAWLARGQREPLPAERMTLLLPALLVMAVMGVAASFVVRKTILARGGRGLDAWFAATIIAQALREGAAVIGLLLTLLSGAMWPVVACASLAVAALVLGFPKAQDLEDHLRS